MTKPIEEMTVEVLLKKLLESKAFTRKQLIAKLVNMDKQECDVSADETSQYEMDKLKQ